MYLSWIPISSLSPIPLPPAFKQAQESFTFLITIFDSISPPIIPSYPHYVYIYCSVLFSSLSLWFAYQKQPLKQGFKGVIPETVAGE